MATTFSAGAQALGYLYQARVALFQLLQSPDEAQIKIEALDDIELAGAIPGQKITLTQLKHHVSKAADLTDFSSDLWKSIRVWAEQAKDRKFVLADARLFLITTAKSASGGIASKLGIENRDAVQAEKRLLEVAAESKNKELKSAFEAFLSLSDAQRVSLVSSITVLDEHPNIDDYKARIEKLIRPAVRKKYVSSLFERLEGWWFDLVVQHLLGPAAVPFISAFELNEKIASLAESFHEENLPIDFMHDEPTDGFVADSEGKLFVRQLSSLEIKPRVVRKAIFDYFRAFQQRSRWLSEGLVLPDELVTYEKTLVDEWERYFDTVSSQLEEDVAERDLIECGRRVLAWAELEATHLKIRPRVEADFIRRGSFHILANKEPVPSVHWHPKFIEKLEIAMASAAGSI